jgi:hypothetical protein
VRIKKIVCRGFQTDKLRIETGGNGFSPTMKKAIEERDKVAGRLRCPSRISPCASPLNRPTRFLAEKPVALTARVACKLQPNFDFGIFERSSGFQGLESFTEWDRGMISTAFAVI